MRIKLSKKVLFLAAIFTFYGLMSCSHGDRADDEEVVAASDAELGDDEAMPSEAVAPADKTKESGDQELAEASAASTEGAETPEPANQEQPATEAPPLETASAETPELTNKEPSTYNIDENAPADSSAAVTEAVSNVEQQEVPATPETYPESVAPSADMSGSETLPPAPQPIVDYHGPRKMNKHSKHVVMKSMHKHMNKHVVKHASSSNHFAATNHTPSGHGRYVVMPGETLGIIAKKILGAKAGWKKLANASDMKNPHRIFPGDVIFYPINAQSKIFASNYKKMQSESVKIGRGDSLSSIAQKVYGNKSYWKIIWRLNESKIRNPNHIYAGLTLKYMKMSGGISEEAEDVVTDVPEVKPPVGQNPATLQPPQSNAPHAAVEAKEIPETVKQGAAPPGGQDSDTNASPPVEGH